MNLIHPPLTNTKSAAPLGVPVQIMADPAVVGRKLAKKIRNTGPIVAPDFATAIGVRVSGKVGGTVRGIPLLLLTTTGRKTGKTRTKPLMYLAADKSWVVVASNAAESKPPAWWLNLRRNPHATIQVGSNIYQVVARKANPQERQRLWPLVIQTNPFYGEYQKRTSREIDVVILEDAEK